MTRETRVYLIHAGVYWKCLGGTDSNGEPIYAPPIEIRCRVEDHAHEVFDKEGRRLETNFRAYTGFLMYEKDALWTDKTLWKDYLKAGAGTMIAKLNQSNLLDPYLNDANEIRKNYNMPNARGNDTLYVSFS